MKAIFSLEDAFDITSRGTAITGRIKEGVVDNGDFIIINDDVVSIIAIERFKKSFSGAKEGDNVGLLIGAKYSKDEMRKFRGESFIIEDAGYLRECKLKQLGI